MYSYLLFYYIYYYEYGKILWATTNLKYNKNKTE